MLSEASSTSSSPIEGLLQRAGELYTLPAVAMEVLRLTESSKVDTRKIKECIERDPALTLKILKAVNSPAFGLSGEVSDLNHSLALLGIKPLKLLVLGFSLPRNLLEGIHRGALARYWEYALTEAVAARELSRTLGLASPDEALLCGLVAEIGTLILLRDVGESYADFLYKVEREGADLVQLELETMGFDHLVLGVRLLQSWNLPTRMTEAISQSRIREPGPDGPPSELAKVLEMARLTAEILVRQRVELLPELIDRMESAGGADLSLEDLVLAVQEQMMQLADALVVSVDKDRDYPEIMLTAYHRLAELAAEVASPLAQQQAAAEASADRAGWTETARLAAAIQPIRGLAVRPSPAAADPPMAVVCRDAHYAHLTPTVEKVAARCREKRLPLSLVWLKINGFPEQAEQWDLPHLERLLKLAAAIATDQSDGLARCLPNGEASLVLLLADCDRQPAIELARRVVQQVSAWSHRVSDSASTTLAAGVATVCWVPPNFRAEDLLDSAARCGAAAAMPGGGGVKSIEVL